MCSDVHTCVFTCVCMCMACVMCTCMCTGFRTRFFLRYVACGDMPPRPYSMPPLNFRCSEVASGAPKGWKPATYKLPRIKKMIHFENLGGGGVKGHCDPPSVRNPGVCVCCVTDTLSTSPPHLLASMLAVAVRLPRPTRPPWSWPRRYSSVGLASASISLCWTLEEVFRDTRAPRRCSGGSPAPS